MRQNKRKETENRTKNKENMKKEMETFGHSKKYAYLCIAIKKRALSSAGLEHLPYKQRVGGSNPSAPTKINGNGCFPEWPNGADCKSAVFRLRWFESISTHKEACKCFYLHVSLFLVVFSYIRQ